MPIYEYRCEKCGDFEQMQRITDAALERCPTCRRRVRRLISSTSFQLKGGGWYVTDYARAGSGNGSKKDAGESGAKADAKDTAKSEKKAESSTGEKPTS
jgi:putative FmdB family regulatory protein